MSDKLTNPPCSLCCKKGNLEKAHQKIKNCLQTYHYQLIRNTFWIIFPQISNLIVNCNSVDVVVILRIRLC